MAWHSKNRLRWRHNAPLRRTVGRQERRCDCTATGPSPCLRGLRRPLPQMWTAHRTSRSLDARAPDCPHQRRQERRGQYVSHLRLVPPGEERRGCCDQVTRHQGPVSEPRYPPAVTTAQRRIPEGAQASHSHFPHCAEVRSSTPQEPVMATDTDGWMKMPHSGMTADEAADFISRRTPVTAEAGEVSEAEASDFAIVDPKGRRIAWGTRGQADAIDLSDAYPEILEPGYRVEWLCPILAARRVQPKHTANCCECGRIVDTREAKDGGDGFGSELDDGRWTCSGECWEKAVGIEQDAPSPDVAGLIAVLRNASVGHPYALI